MSIIYQVPRKLWLRMILLIPGYFILVPAVLLTPSLVFISFILFASKSGAAITGSHIIRLLIWGFGVYVLLKAFVSTIGNIIVPNKTRHNNDDLFLCNTYAEPLLYEFINNLADRINSPRPKHIVLDPKPVLYATNRRISGANINVNGLILVIGLPYLRILSIVELQSLLTHELAHFSGYDLFYSRMVRPFVYGLFNASLITQRLASSWKAPRRKRELILLPLYSLWNQAVGVARLPNFLLNRYLNEWLLTTNEFHRLREVRADIIAAKTCGRGHYSRALTKAVGVQMIFSDYIQDSAISAIQSNTYPGNLFIKFQTWHSCNKSIVCSRIQEELQKSASSGVHPPLHDRLQVIKETSINDSVYIEPFTLLASNKLLTSLDGIEEVSTEKLLLGQIAALKEGSFLLGDVRPTLADKQSQVLWTYSPPFSHFEKRAYAFITDTLITAFLAFMLFAFIINLKTVDKLIAFILSFIAFPCIYHAYFELSDLNSTPGKRLFHLKLESYVRHQLGFFQSIARLLFRFIYGLFFFIAIPVNAVAAIISSDYRMLYDVLAGTQVNEVLNSKERPINKYRFRKLDDSKAIKTPSISTILYNLPSHIKIDSFSSKAQKVLLLAELEAKRFNQKFVGTELILLGLLAEGTGRAAKILKAAGLNIKDTRLEIGKYIRRGSDFTSDTILLTPRAECVLETSLEEAFSSSQLSIDTEHLLLAIIKTGNGVALTILNQFGISLDILQSIIEDETSGET